MISNFVTHAKVYDESSGKIILFVNNLLMYNEIISTTIFMRRLNTAKQKLILEAESNIN